MAAYVIADVKVTNPDIFREYMNQVPSTVERYGGKYLVRGGSLEQFEGVWEPSRLVIIEFDNMDNGKNCTHPESMKELLNYDTSRPKQMSFL